MITPEIIDLFMRRVLVGDGCWPMTNKPHHTGYYQLHIGGVKVLGAHRVAYELLVGPIGEGLQIDHLCRNRACVNPAHMEPVTNRENGLRGNSPWGVNARKTHCVHGHAFTAGNVRMYRTGKWLYRRCKTCENIRSQAYKARRERANG